MRRLSPRQESWTFVHGARIQDYGRIRWWETKCLSVKNRAMAAAHSLHISAPCGDSGVDWHPGFKLSQAAFQRGKWCLAASAAHMGLNKPLVVALLQRFGKMVTVWCEAPFTRSKFSRHDATRFILHGNCVAEPLNLFENRFQNEIFNATLL